MEKTQQFLIPISIVIAGALIAVGIFFGGSGSSNVGSGSGQTPEVNIRPISSDDHILGDPNADLIIVEYSDIECPFCKQFHNTLHQAIDEYGQSGKVAWVYRHFPIDQLHQNARKEAEATECAAEQGGNNGFWKYIDEIYKRTPSNDGLPLTELPVIAGDVGLDVAKFNECLSSGRMADKVEADHADAIAAGGQGTPYVVFLKGKEKIPMSQGAVPYATLKGMIEELLK
jgi:protein-disulfide isomerase